jgi:hypothetical protein
MREVFLADSHKKLFLTKSSVQVRFKSTHAFMNKIMFVISILKAHEQIFDVWLNIVIKFPNITMPSGVVGSITERLAER